MPFKRHIASIEKVKTYINNHSKERLNITNLAAHFSVSESYLRKTFKQHYGITVHQYHLQITMQYALSAIEEGEAIGDVAHRLGYDFPGSFTRTFKIVHKVTPQSYKR